MNPEPSSPPAGGLIRNRRYLVLIAAMLGALFAGLDQMIMVTALPRVVAELGGLQHFAWVFAAYMLTSTVTVPLYGKLSDIYGRRPFWLAGLALFMAGSAVAGVSQEMTQLIVARAVQGVGAGALMALAPALIGDIFPPAERGKWQGLLAAIFGVVILAGPALGGLIADHWSWRWVFYVNLPFGALAVAIAWRWLPRTGRGYGLPIDFTGAALLVGAAVPLLLALSWAGSRYPWASPPIVGLFAAAALFAAALVLVERRVREPIFDLNFFRNRVYAVTVLAVLLVGAGMLGAMIYLPLFVQAVMGRSAADSGFVLVPMILAFIISAIVAGQVMSRTGRYKLLVLGLFATAIAGAILLGGMDARASEGDIVRNMIVMGLGIGGLLSVLTVVAQNALPDRHLGQVSAGVRFFRSTGSTLGVALFGSLLAARFAGALPAELPESVRAALQDPRTFLEQDGAVALQQQLTTGSAEDLIALLRGALAESITSLFALTAVLLAAGFIACLFLRELPLRKSHQRDRQADSSSEVAASTPTRS